MKFPNLVYRCPGECQCPGGTYKWKQVMDESELAERLKEGWHGTLAEAIQAAKPQAVAGMFVPTKKIPDPEPEPEQDYAPTRAELEEKANELGIRFDGRTTDAKLLARIAEALDG